MIQILNEFFVGQLFETYTTTHRGRGREQSHDETNAYIPNSDWIMFFI